MKIKKMRHAADMKAEQVRQKMLEQKREKLFRNLALIHALSHIMQIAYYDSIKDSNFRNPKIKAKADLLKKHSEDIIKSLGEGVRLKEEAEDFMLYEHNVEVYELLRSLVFTQTDVIIAISKLLDGDPKTLIELMRKE